LSILPLLYKYHEFYNIFYYISSFANPVLTYRCYANELNIEPSNTNKYITGTLNKGQRKEKGKERKGGRREGPNGRKRGERPRGGKGE
jgi:hypothetical protein